MKSSQVKKIAAVFVGTICFASVNAFAQADDSNNIQTQQNNAYQANQKTTASSNPYDNRSGVVIRGGYNVGRNSVRDVPGCVGPASFCNMYFGN